MKNKGILLFISVVAIFNIVLLIILLPKIIYLINGIHLYNERIKERDDYTKITTTLSRKTIDDICLQFDIEADDERCLPNSVVYGPDFFPDIKKFVNDFPKNQLTRKIVDEKIGKYLVNCEIPSAEGIYACDYDLRGDGLYKILVFFNQEDFFYQIIANTGGS